MQHNIKNLLGFTLEATDGEVGKVKDFYFDDDTWTIRYLIVKTGGWLSGREVLISPVAISGEAYDANTFPVNLTKEQVNSSPDIDTDKPVSRQQELALYDHYAWQRYGGGGFYAGGVWEIAYPAISMADEKSLIEEDRMEAKSHDDLHLRSTHTVSGYHVHALDGDIGHVTDFIMDDQTWQLLFFVVDTHNWFGGKKVLIPVSDIKEVQWDNSKIIIDITTDAVKSSKLFDELEFSFPVNIFEL